MLNQIIHFLLKQLLSELNVTNVSFSLSHLLFMELNVFHSQAAAAHSVRLLVAVFLVASPEDGDGDGRVGHVDKF